MSRPEPMLERPKNNEHPSLRIISETNKTLLAPFSLTPLVDVDISCLQERRFLTVERHAASCRGIKQDRKLACSDDYRICCARIADAVRTRLEGPGWNKNLVSPL